MPQLQWEDHDHGSWWTIAISITPLYFQINVSLSMMDNTFLGNFQNVTGRLNPAAQSRWGCCSSMSLGPNSNKAGLYSYGSVLVGAHTDTHACNVYIYIIYMASHTDQQMGSVLVQTRTAATTTSCSPRWLLRIKTYYWGVYNVYVRTVWLRPAAGL